jgi:Zn-dependent protease with chaperone function
MSGGAVSLMWLMFLLIAGAWVLSSLALPPIIRWLLTGVHDPAARGRRVLSAALIPWLVPATIGAAALATAASKTLGWIADHCPHHGLGHPHLCFSHLPAVDLGVVHGAVAGAIAMPVVLSLVRLLRSEYRAVRDLNLLRMLSTSRGRLRIVSATAPFALAGGLFEPVVLCSDSLLKQLSCRERRIVLAHEAAHLRRGDTRRRVLFELLLLLHLPMVRRRLRVEWLRALEERADETVARRFGADQVVATLLRVARLELRQPVPGFSVAGANLAERAQRLLDGGGGRRIGRSFEAAYLLGLAALFTVAVLGHHGLETLLGVIPGH